MNDRHDPEAMEDRWRRIVSADARGEIISADDLAFRSGYERVRGEVAAEAPLWDAIGRLGAEPLVHERGSDDLVAAAIAGIDTPQPVLDEPEPAVLDTPRPRWGVVIGVGAALAAAAAVVLMLLPPAALEGGSTGSPMTLSTALDTTPARAARAIEAHPPPTSIERTPKKRTAGTVSPPAPEAVTEPEATPLEADDPPPSRAKRRRPAKAEHPTTADEWLGQAQRQLGEGDRTGALRSYDQLIARFPRTPEATAALVSVGRIHLRRGAARKALRAFDAYLAAAAGPLTEEARYGRIKALRKLGRTQQERASITAFLADHPKSLYAARLRARADELDAPPSP